MTTKQLQEGRSRLFPAGEISTDCDTKLTLDTNAFLMNINTGTNLNQQRPNMQKKLITKKDKPQELEAGKQNRIGRKRHGVGAETPTRG